MYITYFSRWKPYGRYLRSIFTHKTTARTMHMTERYFFFGKEKRAHIGFTIITPYGTFYCMWKYVLFSKRSWIEVWRISLWENATTSLISPTTQKYLLFWKLLHLYMLMQLLWPNSCCVASWNEISANFLEYVKTNSRTKID